MIERHPLIQQFQEHAEILDIMKDKSNLDDAINLLAEWIDQHPNPLKEDEMEALINIGGILYREGSRQRMG